MDTQSFEDFIAAYSVKMASDEIRHQRRGQFFFNFLYRHRPDIADKLHSTPLDPFYLDDRLDAAINFVRENW